MALHSRRQSLARSTCAAESTTDSESSSPLPTRMRMALDKAKGRTHRNRISTSAPRTRSMPKPQPSRMTYRVMALASRVHEPATPYSIDAGSGRHVQPQPVQKSNARRAARLPEQPMPVSKSGWICMGPHALQATIDKLLMDEQMKAAKYANGPYEYHGNGDYEDHGWSTAIFKRRRIQVQNAAGQPSSSSSSSGKAANKKEVFFRPPPMPRLHGSIRESMN